LHDDVQQRRHDRMHDGRCAHEVRSEVTHGPARLLSALTGPPKVGFHGVLAGGTGLLLWAFSAPGFSMVHALVSLPVLAVLVPLWLVKLLLFPGQHRRWSAWFALAPVVAVIVVVLLAARVPLDVRWAMSRDAFEAVVASLPPPTSRDEEWSPLSVPEKIGSYRIDSADRVPDGGVIFYEASGNLLDDAGFAFLPGGPTQSLDTDWFESPVFRRLGGGWYSWTASW
jgi:hypothetical protein